MSRVRIEIWDNDDNIQQAEAEHIDPREAFERAVRMARAALPEPPKRETVLTLNNVKFTEAESGVLFGQAIPPNNYTVQVTTVGGGGAGVTDRKPCGETCAVPDEECSDTCARPAGHDDWHVTADGACSWSGSESGRADPAKCGAVCSFKTCWTDCQRPKDHKGDHRCDRPKDHKRCLNEIGTPSQTQNCQKPLDHEGDCAGGND